MPFSRGFESENPQCRGFVNENPEKITKFTMGALKISISTRLTFSVLKKMGTVPPKSVHICC